MAIALEWGVITVAGAAPASGDADASVLFRSSRFTPNVVMEDADGGTAAASSVKE